MGKSALCGVFFVSGCYSVMTICCLLSSSTVLLLFSVQASNITIEAGKSSGKGNTGGAITIKGGTGSVDSGTDKYFGGDGGNVHLTGGSSSGNHLINDRAGNVILEGGASHQTGSGGGVQLISGAGPMSGALLLETRKMGERHGNSGPIEITSGEVKKGVSGELYLETGQATEDKGQSGSIIIQTGSAGQDITGITNHYRHHPSFFSNDDDFPAGGIELTAGTSYKGTGGSIDLEAGGGSFQGGDVQMTAGTGLSDSLGGDVLISGGRSRIDGGYVIVQGGFGERYV